MSISEATYLASSQGSRKRRHATFERTRSGLAEAISPALESSRSPSQATQGLDSYALDIGLDGSFDGQITGARRLRTASDHEINSPRLATPSTSQGMDVAAQVLSPASEVVRTNPFQDDGVDHESDQPGEAENPFLWPDSTSVAQATAHAGQSPSQHVQHRARPRPNALDTAAAQDISLPSPSLSPVTAAANLQSRRGYYEDENHANRTSADYNLSQAHNQNQVEKYSFQDGMLESQGSIKSTITPYPTGGLHISNHLSSTPSMMDIPTMLTSFEAMPAEMKTYVMYQLLRRCPKPVLHFVADTVGPALKCDFISLLPLELSLNIICHLDVKTLCRAAQVSKKWRQIVDSDEKAWKNLLDADGYILPDGELQRAIREGWGWQHASRPDDWEKDLGAAGPVASDTEWSVTSAHGVLGGLAALTSSSSDLATPPTKRPKRKAATKSKTKPRKQQKKQDANMELATNVDMEAWKDKSSSCEGPYAAANAAAAAVPFPEVGLPRLKNLHLFKSIYQRHHIIRKSWMQDETKPRHIAFRAHQRHVVTCLQFDTDKILTGSDDKNINVYDTQTGALRARLEGHEGGVWALQYEGNVLVSGSTDRSVRVWDIEKGVCTHVFQGHTSTVRCLQILMPTAIQEPDGTITMMPKQPLIITGSRDSNLRVWELPKPNDKPFFQAGPPPDEKECPYFVRVLTGHQQSVRAIAAHADTLVSGSYDYTVRVWKISTGETVHRLQGHTQKVYSVVLDHKRNRCISGSMDNHVKIWSLETGMALFNLEGHSSLVGLLDLQQDRLVSAAADSTLRIWDPENGNCKSTLTAHTGAITCFQHDGQKVISGSDRTLKMWNISTGEFVKDLLTELSGVWQVKFNERRCVAAVQRNNLTYIEASFPYSIGVLVIDSFLTGSGLWRLSRRCSGLQAWETNRCQHRRAGDFGPLRSGR